MGSGLARRVVLARGVTFVDGHAGTGGGVLGCIDLTLGVTLVGGHGVTGGGVLGCVGGETGGALGGGHGVKGRSVLGGVGGEPGGALAGGLVVAGGGTTRCVAVTLSVAVSRGHDVTVGGVLGCVVAAPGSTTCKSNGVYVGCAGLVERAVVDLRPVGVAAPSAHVFKDGNTSASHEDDKNHGARGGRASCEEVCARSRNESVNRHFPTPVTPASAPRTGGVNAVGVVGGGGGRAGLHSNPT